MSEKFLPTLKPTESIPMKQPLSFLLSHDCTVSARESSGMIEVKSQAVYLVTGEVYELTETIPATL